ncbi:MAG: hypothetical protein RJA70_3071 [Pseudomonadota bacterium]
MHQTSDSVLLTTNQGVAISDDQNSLRVGPRGPTLLEDFVLREKITHFDHERIPERVVHARGSGAHGFFETLAPLSQYTRADFLQEAGAKVPVFVRFSTVAGGAGSVDLPRDVRGFAVKFYTREGNFDLVGNNIPVFFIQDAIKFPDLVHSVKMEPDRGFPQAASAHDTFWDFMSLTPESTHMVMWAMSDRAIPRSYRMIEGFGVHTFRLVNKQGGSTFVKFHWRPKLGLQSVVWDEAIKINGADSDYHRRDLWHAIESGNFPEWELFVQLFTEEDANGFDFDVLDATKLIPEELVPLIRVGRLVLDRNPTNFFAETEQVAFCAANIVPGIDFTNDPLLQGRLFSYLDTQLLRLGGPNFNQLPINAPKCPMHNFQRDGHMQMALPAGRVNYEPNTLAPGSARENPRSGFRTFPRSEGGGALRVRPEAFADHYSQARLFWKSQTEYEQGHIVAAYVFELSKVETDEIRERVISHLVHVDPALASRVCAGLGLERIPAKAATNVPPKEMPPSPSLSIIHKSQPILTGRSLACLVTEGVSATLVEALLKAVEAEGAELKIIAPKIGGVVQDNGQRLAADAALSGGPSVLFDAVVILACDQGIGDLLTDAAAVAFVVDAYHHLKVIGHSADATPLLLAAQVPLAADAGVVSLSARADVEGFITAAKQHRIWERERRIKVVV